MLHRKNIFWVLLAVSVAGLLSGCYKDKTVVADTGEEITRTVTFSNDIVPVFNSSCNGSGCHSAGGTAPDLTAANALLSLTSGNYLNTAEPDKSELYQWMTGKRTLPMPLSGPNKDYNALILAWIKQGAQNN